MKSVLPYEIIVRSYQGDPEAVRAVLHHYARYIRFFSNVNGHFNADIENEIIQTLIESLFKFLLDSIPAAPLESRSRLKD